MSILNSISNYFGSSESHATSASTHLSNANIAASSGANNVIAGASTLFSTTAGIAGVSAWNSFDWVAGKIITTNSATQFANWGASLIGGTPVTGYAAQATGFAATMLVQYPVGSMLALLSTSIMATHPKATFEAIKKSGESVYDFVKAGVELTAAVTEAALALGLKAIELLDSAMIDPLSDIELDLFADNSQTSEEVDVIGKDHVDPLGGFAVTEMEV